MRGHLRHAPGLSRREQRGASSKTSCTCGKHGGCCKLYACGSHSTAAYANVNKPRLARGLSGVRAQAPRLAQEDLVADAKHDFAPLFFRCGCDLCWQDYYSAGDDHVPQAHRYDSYEFNECAQEAQVCETLSGFECIPSGACDERASCDEPALAAERASTCDSDEMSWEVVSDPCDSDSAWDYVVPCKEDDFASTHSIYNSGTGSLGVGATYVQVVMASL
jgi:hypothetical protein